MVSPDVLALVPRWMAIRYSIFPVSTAPDGTLVVASDRIVTSRRRNAIATELGRRVEFRLATRSDLAAAIRWGYEKSADPMIESDEARLIKRLIDASSWSAKDVKIARKRQKRAYRSLGSILVREGAISQRTLDAAVDRLSGREGVRLGEYLVGQGLITRPELTRALDRAEREPRSTGASRVSSRSGDSVMVARPYLCGAMAVVAVAVATTAWSQSRRNPRFSPRFPVFDGGLSIPLGHRVVYREDVVAGDGAVTEGRTSRANALYQRGLKQQEAGDLDGARKSFEAALMEDPGSTVIRASLGYVLYAAGDLKAARAVFEETVRRDPSATALFDELGYLNLRLGEPAAADGWFRRAIDAHRREQPSTPADAEARDERVYRLRSEVREIENRFDGTLYSLIRRGSGNAAPNPTGRSLTQSQGGAEGAYRLPIDGLGQGRMVQVFGRVLWGYRRDSLHIRGNSYQGGVGIRAKPLASQNLILSFERLVSLGSAARDDWLARIGYSWSTGTGFEPFRKSWPYLSVYGDAALAFPSGPDLFLTGELRAGQSWRLGSRVSVTPHVVLAGSRQEDGPGDDPSGRGRPRYRAQILFRQIGLSRLRRQCGGAGAIPREDRRQQHRYLRRGCDRGRELLRDDQKTRAEFAYSK